MTVFAIHHDLVARAKEITAREKAVYSERTKRSQIATERARKVMPAGAPSSFQAYEPWPIAVKHAAGSRMIDVDDIVEPVMQNIGICLPEPGYLEAVRDITEHYG